MVKKAGGVLLPSLMLDHAASKPLAAQLAAGLRDLLLSGALRAGDRLPATRTIAADLGVSRTTVVEAFERLATEGLIVARTGAGSFVSEALASHQAVPQRRAAPPGPAPRLSKTVSRRAEALFDRLPHVPRAFTTALPAFDAFPMALWARHVAKHWRGGRDVVMGYGDAQGFPPLRRAIAAHLRASRGIACDPYEIIIVNGAQHGFQLISNILLDPGDRVWFENPGAIGARNCFVAAGAKLVPVPVDADGMMVHEGLRRAAKFRLAFVTPSHQQPLGTVMSLERRLSLLAAAERAGGWIIEDDYDGEFCYHGHPPPTLRSIDLRGRVIYVGTFSKTLFPALRLGYVLLPPGLVDVFRRFTAAYSSGVPSNAQAVVAVFMEEGHFSAHIRRMRKLYAERYAALRDAAASRLAGLVEVAHTDTGLHTVADLICAASEADVAEQAHARGITVSPLGRYCISRIERQALVLGFSGIRPEEIRKGAAVLRDAIEDVLRARQLFVGSVRSFAYRSRSFDNVRSRGCSAKN
jgi:GntR family transcriptional regulator / MocR family aminotransferase